MKNKDKLELQNHVDPVCGMSVDPDHAKRDIYQGETFYFCSEECKGKFQAAPADYAHSVIAK